MIAYIRQTPHAGLEEACFCNVTSSAPQRLRLPRGSDRTTEDVEDLHWEI